MNEPPSHLYSAAHFASDDVRMITFGAAHDHLDRVIHFFKMYCYKVWLSASESSDIFVHIYISNLNWGYDDAMATQYSIDQAIAHSEFTLKFDAKWHIYMYNSRKFQIGLIS